MTRRKVRLDFRGVGDVLKSREMTAVVEAAGEAVASNVKAQGIRVGDRDGRPREVDMPVDVQMQETDRAVAVVAINHPSGEAVQAKHGALTKAAAEAGLEVRSRFGSRGR